MATVAVLEVNAASPHVEASPKAKHHVDNEGDSGHWSVECPLPFTGKSVTDEELVAELYCEVSIVEHSDISIAENSDVSIPELSDSLADTLSITSSTDSEISHPHISSVVSDTQCIVCLDELDQYDFYEQNTISSTPCCKRTVCSDCMHQIIATNVNEGRVQIRCPHPECGKLLPKTRVLSYISGRKDRELRAKYARFCVDFEGDSSKKTCPNCCLITEHHLPKLRRLKETQLKITCTECQLQWCFRCHAPWHANRTCKQFQKGDTEFKRWTTLNDNKGKANCQKCPTCRVYIQRSTGCPHMTCSRCETHFCYNCGGRFVDFLTFDHIDDELEIWGCPKTFLPNSPVQRKVIKGGWLGARLSFLLAYPPLLIGAVVVVVVGGVVILPAYGIFKLYRYHNNMKKYKQRRRR